MTKAFNPLAVDDLAPAPKTRNRQSTEPAPEPASSPVMDTTTPAYEPATIRRFTLGDLPRYADKLFPILQGIYPHLNDRMYGGWLRGCTSDNSCLFVCADGKQAGEGAVLMAHIMHWPMNPRPTVKFTFFVGAEQHRKSMLDFMLKWAAELGAEEVWFNGISDVKFFDGTKNHDGDPEKRNVFVLHVG